MPTGPRIRSNSEFGLITDNPLTAGATTFNSARLALMPVVSAAHAVVTLDPRAVNGEPEIVIITAHTAAATVATITRGAYGTVARSHPAATEWIHAPIDEDFIEILTSSTRPSDPYEGQFIFEADTNKLVGYGGVDWAPRDAGGYLGHGNLTANQTATFATETALTGATTTVTIGTGRRIKISWFFHVRADAVPSSLQFLLNDGGTDISLSESILTNAGQRETIMGQHILVPTPGSHTYSMSGIRNVGTPNFTVETFFSATTSHILVEDIGAA